MVVEIMRDETISIIEVRHCIPKETIEKFVISPEIFHQAQIEQVKKELKEDYPDYYLNFATRNKDYEPLGKVGLVMWYTARGVKYFERWNKRC